jgi:hypothetical protein
VLKPQQYQKLDENQIAKVFSLVFDCCFT